MRAMFWTRRMCVMQAAALAAVMVRAAAAYAAATDAPAALPACPHVQATLDATIDTKVVKAGERFAFTTRTPIEVGNLTIPAASHGVGLIATLDHSKSQGHSGYLVLEARYVVLADGSHIPVVFVPAGDGHAQSFVRAGSSDAGLLGYLPYYIGTAAGIYNTFHHGKDAAVVAGTVLPLIVGDDFYAGTCGIAIDRR